MIEEILLESKLLRLVAKELTVLLRGENVDVLAHLFDELSSVAVYDVDRVNFLHLIPVDVVRPDGAACDSLSTRTVLP